MKKTLAVPAHLIKDKYTKEEQRELASFGDQPLSDEEKKQREVDEQTHKQNKVIKNNDRIKSKLDEIDLKSIRAMREGNQKIIEELEKHAAELRKRLV